MQCIVCADLTRPGLAQWHARCPSCHYESARLASFINVSHAHDAVNEDDRQFALKTLRSENFKTIVARLKQLVSPTATRLLDVGSAHGWFLELAGAHFEVLGIEPDAAVGGRAAKQGLAVREGYFPDALLDDEQFDVIVFNDVIEHIPDIASALGACYARLNKDGLLVLNLPSSQGFFYRLSKLFAGLSWRAPFERMWQKGLPSPHVHYFNERNLAQLVARHGFEPVDTFKLASLRSAGLLERLRFAGPVNPLMLYAQYIVLMAVMPVLRLLPSDIVVCVFRTRASQASKASRPG